MSDKYKMHEAGKAYFVTLTVVDWIDVFTKKSHALQIVNSLKFCQEFKGLEIFGWCLMPNHLHMIARASGLQALSEILRDFKKFTSRIIVKNIIDQSESRREWMLARFKYNGKYLKRIKNYKFWQDGNHAILIYSSKIFYQKLNYIHKNPVKAGIVSRQEDYLYSSGRNYAGMDFLLPVILETPRLITVR